MAFGNPFPQGCPKWRSFLSMPCKEFCHFGARRWTEFEKARSTILAEQFELHMKEDYPVGYCTNVHAGPNLTEAKENLIRYACRVREQVHSAGKLPVGLWLAEQAATDLLADGVEPFREWLSTQQLIPYTFNGFPQKDFHQSVVKHAVYEPTWLEPERLRFTEDLAVVLAELLPEGGVGSISTLPLGWPHQDWDAGRLQQAAANLRLVAAKLHAIYEEQGKEIVLAIEPEPGCVLDTAEKIVRFFREYLFAGSDEIHARRHLTVCHDMCHSAVMWESQAGALQLYLEAGIRVGKVQVSSAVHVPWDRCEQDAQRHKMWSQLAEFNEPKYLHQVTRGEPDAAGQIQRIEMEEDLSLGLEKWEEVTKRQNPWRVHFHVPIYLEEFGALETTRSDIEAATRFLEAHRQTVMPGGCWFTGHYEVETYAWPVLPQGLQVEDLSTGIANELEYFKQQLASFEQTKPAN